MTKFAPQEFFIFCSWLRFDYTFAWPWIRTGTFAWREHC